MQIYQLVSIILLALISIFISAVINLKTSEGNTQSWYRINRKFIHVTTIIGFILSLTLSANGLFDLLPFWPILLLFAGIEIRVVDLLQEPKISKKLKFITRAVGNGILVVAIFWSGYTSGSTNPRYDIIVLFGSAENGVKYVVPVTGSYNIKVVDGAYSTQDSDAGTNNGEWRTVVQIYRNGSIQRGQREGLPVRTFEPISSDATVGRWDSTDWPTEQEAREKGAQSSATQIYSEAQDVLIFVPVDNFGFYADNRGCVILEISLV